MHGEEVVVNVSAGGERAVDFVLALVIGLTLEKVEVTTCSPSNEWAATVRSLTDRSQVPGAP